MDLIVSKTSNHIEESLDSISSNYDQFSEKQQEIVDEIEQYQKEIHKAEQAIVDSNKKIEEAVLKIYKEYPLLNCNGYFFVYIFKYDKK